MQLWVISNTRAEQIYPSVGKVPSKASRASDKQAHVSQETSYHFLEEEVVKVGAVFRYSQSREGQDNHHKILSLPQSKSNRRLLSAHPRMGIENERALRSIRLHKIDGAQHDPGGMNGAQTPDRKFPDRSMRSKSPWLRRNIHTHQGAMTKMNGATVPTAPAFPLSAKAAHAEDGFVMRIPKVGTNRGMENVSVPGRASAPQFAAVFFGAERSSTTEEPSIKRRWCVPQKLQTRQKFLWDANKGFSSSDIMPSRKFNQTMQFSQLSRQSWSQGCCIAHLTDEMQLQVPKSAQVLRLYWRAEIMREPTTRHAEKHCGPYIAIDTF